MTRAAADQVTDPGDQSVDGPAAYEVVVIGAGVTGLYQLHLLRKAGLSVRLLEAGGGVGGTWYWNRYPGCRLDSESFTYQYVFDEDLLATADWSELFASQPELERYFNDFADRFDLRPDIALNTRVDSMVFDEAESMWTLHTGDGAIIRTRFVVSATGILSAPNFPAVPGLERFQGVAHHTALWPSEPVDFTGKRVAVIGTGASGVQIIPIIAQSASHLTVFQRTPNWAVPLRNVPLSTDDLGRVREAYPETIATVRASSNGFLHDWDTTPFAEVSEQQRAVKYETAWNSPGFAKWFGMYRDIAVDPVANRTYCDFIAAKIRERVTDPAVADKLIPTDHLFGTKRVPCETNYYETYNRENVTLVALADNPILEFTESGLTTADGPMDFDVIVLATGFDAFTGALSRIDIRGVGQQTLQDTWKDGPKTYMGLQIAGFPNLLVNGGPHGKGGVGNSPRCAEPVIIWIAELLAHMRDNGLTRIEADAEAETAWTEHVNELAATSMAAGIKSYSYGDNVPGKPHAYVAYSGSLPDFVQRLDRTTAEGYPGFRLS